MNIIGKEKIYEFKRAHPDAATQIDSWLAEVEEANWAAPSDVKNRYVKASILPDNQVVFNIRGNRYRLLVQISYKNKIVLIKKVGTHEEYMKW